MFVCVDICVLVIGLYLTCFGGKIGHALNMCSLHGNHLLIFYWLLCLHGNWLTLRLQSQTSLLSGRIQHA